MVESQASSKPSANSEARPYFALATHVVTPLLKSISDVTELSRKKYVERHPNVAASDMHLFKESTSEERHKLEQLVKRLDEASAGLQSTSTLGQDVDLPRLVLEQILEQ